MQKEIKEVSSRFFADIGLVNSLSDLLQLKARYLGRGGVAASLFAKAKNAPSEEERLVLLSSTNTLLSEIAAAIKQKHDIFQEEALKEKLSAEKIDVTYPRRTGSFGRAHLLSKAQDRVLRIFASMGFSLAVGPEIEDQYHNFDALNTPKHHPARRIQDTFYLEGGKKVLRTHTTSVQVRTMEGAKPPFRAISIGRVYRHDWDATHTPMFHQVDGFCVEENINMSSMKSCIENFIQQFFGSANFRMRPSNFPFTEPSAEVDIKNSKGSWLEVLGCGMIHPKVLSNVGIDSKKYTGFAFGMGLERITMLRHNVFDIRNFFSGDVRWKVVS